MNFEASRLKACVGSIGVRGLPSWNGTSVPCPLILLQLLQAGNAIKIVPTAEVDRVWITRFVFEHISLRVRYELRYLWQRGVSQSALLLDGNKSSNHKLLFDRASPTNRRSAPQPTQTRQVYIPPSVIPGNCFLVYLWETCTNVTSARRLPSHIEHHHTMQKESWPPCHNGQRAKVAIPKLNRGQPPRVDKTSRDDRVLVPIVHNEGATNALSRSRACKTCRRRSTL